ncbi:S-adenosyl-L-methionine-dependent methyltransferase [Linderina pennispora]|uniref:S-adenosyl-L-methionine-dependent methyltransferase n=1 Tax=Linderina pennispora TaxID=61395 RepID=A0A1Y1WAA5_9FUNG|nr:S-adenosyl-L-methionine-dependent methyltransferase [Linderina pennispora]ORX70469.1 S-adenosyl-L-methionine-dependent methyltransferase [Linderina pennispora]
MNSSLAGQATVNSDEYNQIWHNCWNDKRTPWDKGDISPALRELIQDKKWQLPSGQGLVPGCGRGYDAMFLASPQLHMTGADLDATAVATADKLREEKGISKDLADFQVIDFFKFTPPADKYQVAYDYTFFCAIHPLCLLGGELIVLMYPISKDDNPNGGPPFIATEDDYHKVLDANFDLVHVDPQCKTHDDRVGKEIISVWRRK